MNIMQYGVSVVFCIIMDARYLRYGVFLLCTFLLRGRGYGIAMAFGKAWIRGASGSRV